MKHNIITIKISRENGKEIGRAAKQRIYGESQYLRRGQEEDAEDLIPSISWRGIQREGQEARASCPSEQ